MAKIELSTRSKRRGLKARPKPYWEKIEKGLFLGYRKPTEGAGRWYVRLWDSAAERYHEHSMKVVADDLLEADGVSVLSPAQAKERASQWTAKGFRKTKDLTVADAVALYLERSADLKTIDAISRLFDVHVLPFLGSFKLADLGLTELRNWQRDRAESDALLPGGNLRQAVTAEDKRRRKATANRYLAHLKAALNCAADEGLIESRVWQGVKPFKKVDAARERILTVDEAQRFVNATRGSFRQLVRAALATGARVSELGRLRVADWNVGAGSVHIRTSKSGKPRDLYLNEEGCQLFDELAAGLLGEDHLLTKDNGEPWRADHHARFVKPACKLAKIEPGITFHGLRHTYCSLYLMAGGNPSGLAEQLGHSDTTMIYAHYGHLLEDYRAKEAQQFAPSFGFTQSNVTPIVRKRKAN